MRQLTILRNALFFCVPAAFFLQSCALPQKEPAEFAPVRAESYEADALLEYGEGQSAALHLTRYGDALWDASFTEPTALAGVILTFDGDTVSASYKGLAFSVPKSALPAKNMLAAATEALDEAAASETLPCRLQEDGTWSCTGECAGGSYTLTFSESGEPMRFDLPSQPFCLTLSGFTVLQTSAETAASETAASYAPETAVTQAMTETAAETSAA